MKLNALETAEKSELEKEGWVVYRNGWPDFAIEKNGVLRFVEVKSEADEPSAEQNRMFKLLSRYTGITVEIRRPTSAASLADRQEAMKLKNYAAYRAIRPR